ncbi:MAG: hypothetical protein SFW65_09665 [Alphaproteobacteria bacterium]|nr:hypothetical protein [Alphaproteobacteria bacterium]
MPINGNTQPPLQQLLDDLKRSPKLYALLEARLAKEPRVIPHVMLYVPTSEGKHGSTRNAFHKKREAYLPLLAANHRDELIRLGMDDVGLQCMEMGAMPHNAEGKPYAINLDHIIDRGGFDAARGEGRAEQIHADSNLQLVDKETHDLKTWLTNFQMKYLHKYSLQERGQRSNELSKWIITLVPESYPNHAPIAIMDPIQTETVEALVYHARGRIVSKTARAIADKLKKSSGNVTELVERAKRADFISQKFREWAAKREAEEAAIPKRPRGRNKSTAPKEPREG